MKRLLITLTLAVLTIGAASAQRASSRSVNQFNKYNTLLKQKKNKKAYNMLRKSANGGYVKAQYILGCEYKDGLIVSQDLRQVVKWWSMAAERGLAEAQYELGLCYAMGDGVTQDYAKAAEWWQRAAEQGVAEAQYELGCCYALGDGVSYDYAEATKWWRRAATQGVAMAQYELGLCYAMGDGVTQDYDEAAKWWQRAAEQGIAEAQYELGCCYAEGRGVAHNTTEAAIWWSKAADGGVPEAQYELARLYADGAVPDVIDGEKASYMVEVMPKFKGGSIKKFRAWVMGMLKYPQLAQENGIQGTVLVSFVVDKSGNVSRVEVLQSPDPLLTQAATSVIMKSPRWKPGMQRGKYVSVRYTIPIEFKLLQ